MAEVAILEKARQENWTDEELVQRILAGDVVLYEIIMRRYNQRLYRVARAVLRNDAEAEDVAEDTYVRAYEHLDQFAGRASFSTWLTRIAIHEAYARKRRSARMESIEEREDGTVMEFPALGPTPEQQAANSELGNLLEKAILSLPEPYRVVLMLRDVEQMSTSETATALELTEENVKVRLHRARRLVREHLYASAGSMKEKAFAIMGPRCDGIVRRVFKRLPAL
jgi:RNA polymerase sigma-70 factor (ECF subfamily)